jgi:hypothetical protein
MEDGGVEMQATRRRDGRTGGRSAGMQEDGGSERSSRPRRRGPTHPAGPRVRGPRAPGPEVVALGGGGLVVMRVVEMSVAQGLANFSRPETCLQSPCVASDRPGRQLSCPSVASLLGQSLTRVSTNHDPPTNIHRQSIVSQAAPSTCCWCQQWQRQILPETIIVGSGRGRRDGGCSNHAPRFSCPIVASPKGQSLIRAASHHEPHTEIPQTYVACVRAGEAKTN